MMLPTIILRIERWKFNKDFGVYVSNQGSFKDRYKRRIPVKIDKHGYCRINTERGFISAHRLVMFTWRPIPNAEALTVDHLNHNKRDNSVQNLEWVTKEENLRRASEDQLSTAMKEVKKSCKVRAEQTPEQQIYANIPNRQLAKEHRFKCVTTGVIFENGLAAAAWAREQANMTNAGTVRSSSERLVAACKRDGKWYNMDWIMLPKESEEA